MISFNCKNDKRLPFMCSSYSLTRTRCGYNKHTHTHHKLMKLNVFISCFLLRSQLEPIKNLCFTIQYQCSNHFDISTCIYVIAWTQTMFSFLFLHIFFCFSLDGGVLQLCLVSVIDKWANENQIITLLTDRQAHGGGGVAFVFTPIRLRYFMNTIKQPILFVTK